MADESVGIYVHVPFCQRVCPYCDFAVVADPALSAERQARYVDALLAELEARAGHFEGRTLASLYLGGGTPSLLAPASVGRIIEAVGARFPLAPGKSAEITLEVNPSSVERQHLPGFREAGVGRLSIGVQSFDDGTLKRLGRAHRVSEVRATLAAARAVGFDAISLDLIFAAPGQRRHQLAADLDAVAAFAPEHVSAYALTVEEGTPFALAHRRGQLALPDDDEAAAMMTLVRSRLRAAGIPPYEISSYARPGYEAVHNRRYWARQPVLGLGVGAWSTEAPAPGQPFGARRANERDLDAWLARIASGTPSAPGGLEVLSEPVARGEAAFLALRTTAGLEASAFATEFGGTPRHYWDDAIERLVSAGLLHERDNGDLRLTERGVLLADTVFEAFVGVGAEPLAR